MNNLKTSHHIVVHARSRTEKNCTQ